MKTKITITSALLATCLISGGASAENVGTTSDPVVAGNTANAEQIHGTVALIGNDGQPMCTGTLIAPRVVVTAAHCVVWDDGSRASASDVRVASGVLDANQTPGDKMVAVENVIPHPGYGEGASDDPTGLGQTHDIALLLLASEPAGAFPIPVLPMDDFDEVVPAGAPITVTGFGLTSNAPDAGYGRLFTAQTPYQRRSGSEFFAGGPGHPDSCNGDSGGPVYVSHDDAVYLIGATSRAAHNSNQACGDGGIYTLVPAYDSWLRENSDGRYPADSYPGLDSGCSAAAAPGTGFSWFASLMMVGVAVMFARRRREVSTEAA